MKYISLFSGIEAASCAWESLGWEALAFSEVEAFPSAVLAYHYPHVPNVGDMTKHDWSQYRGKVDVMVGGPPCQAFSVAGLRNSLDDSKGNLSLEYARAIDAVEPRYAVTENVPGWLSTKDNAFGCFLGAVVGADAPLVSNLRGGRWTDAGMVIGPKRSAAWRVLDAQYFGVPQRRRRVFLVICPTNGANPASILFERESLQGHPAPSRKARQGTAGGFEVGPTGGRFTDLAPTMDARAKDGPIRNQLGLGVFNVVGHAQYTEGVGTVRESGGDAGGGSETLVAQDVMQGVAGTQSASAGGVSRPGGGAAEPDFLVMQSGANASGMRDVDTSLSSKQQRIDAETETFVVTHPLMGEGFDASEDGGGRGTPLVVTHALDSHSGGSATEDGTGRGEPLVPVVMHENKGGSLAGADHARRLRARASHSYQFVAGFSAGQSAEAGSIAYQEEQAPTLRGAASGTNQVPAIAFGISNQPTPKVGVDVMPTLNSHSRGGGSQEAIAFNSEQTPKHGVELAPTLRAEYNAAKLNVSSVGMQVRRLTPVECEKLQGFPPGWTDVPYRGKPAADGPRYKSIGNSMAVPVMLWIGERIQMVDDILKALAQEEAA